ncbi:GSU3529 family protein [Geobacter sulfurreducens]|uniref:GSU3529 family protein n=1 Tax=Geobacter sulfurreducens TaxID=35554 RepID=UPI000DBB4B51|nr:hypothetical protein [Geobacter sulfurreducens]BBA69906.1 hypothetical protein YM18_1365 [Geobacter sulfurreducens]
MDVCEELREVALRQNAEGEFPEWLLADVLGITDDPERYGDRTHLVETLVSQIREYDPFAGAGCFGTAVGIEEIRATLRHLTLP